MRTLDIWYAHLSEDGADGGRSRQATTLTKGAERGDGVNKAAEKNAERTARKAHTRDSLQALSKLAEKVDGRYRIVSQPPIVIPLRDLAPSVGLSVEELEQHHPRAVPRLPGHACRTIGATCWSGSRSSTWPARSSASAASARERSSCLLQGRDQQDPLFLQVKEATASVLEDHLPKSRYAQPGERVVQGQRMMQAASDIFLGWTKGVEANRYLYWRQLRDMKGSAVVETMAPPDARVLRRIGRDPGPCSRSLGRPDRAWPRTSARRTGSISRSPTSPSATPTRTNATIRRSPTRSDRAASKRLKVFDLRSGTTDGVDQPARASVADVSPAADARRGRHPSCRVSGCSPMVGNAWDGRQRPRTTHARDANDDLRPCRATP